MNKPDIVILGGGPAGCGAAYRVHQQLKGQATLLEQQSVVGGNAGSFEFGGQYVDYGSHRLHHACDPAILEDVKSLLGEDIRNRERHGRIRLRGKWLHFPLKTKDLMLQLDRRFAAGVAVDMFGRFVTSKPNGEETFASVLQANLGETICRDFYFPYARKIWGREPDELSAIQARKRVSAGSFAKLFKRLIKPPGAGYFYYMRRGYGQISEVYATEAGKQGAAINLGSRVVGLRQPEDNEGKWVVETEKNGHRQTLEADYLWSTLPITQVARMMNPDIPPEVLIAAKSMQYRSMVLVYLQLDVDQFTPTDAHYFPEAHISVTRLSEPKNYFGERHPRGTTVLCAELPCSTSDEIWSMSDQELATLVAEDMERAGLKLPGHPVQVCSRRLSHAYPIYLQGYDSHLKVLDEWGNSLPRFLSYGRQGLFAHDNTHHALFMAYCAVDCLKESDFDKSQWNEYRKIFETHVVED